VKVPFGKSSERQQKGGKTFALLLLVFILLLLFAALPLWDGLTVEDNRKEKTLLVLPIRKGECFRLRFTHSVNLSDITDTTEWTGRELILRTSLFTDFGAGVPVLADGIGKEFENTAEGFLISGIDTVQKNNTIPIMLQTVPDHRLIYRGELIFLRELAGGNGYIALRARKVSLMEMLLFGNYASQGENHGAL